MSDTSTNKGDNANYLLNRPQDREEKSPTQSDTDIEERRISLVSSSTFICI